jgi:aspartate racemase
MAMKKIGIVGGVGWPSTAHYYRLICSGANDHFRALGHSPPYPTPPIMIESVNQAQTRALRGRPGQGEAGWTAFDSIFRAAFHRLEAAGCDFGIIASNTPHARLHAIRAGLDLPIISMIDAAVRETQQIGAVKALILGTAVTMRGDLYPDQLRACGIEPNPRLAEAEIDAFQKIIDHEFYQGATDAGHRAIIEICRAHACAATASGPPDTAVLLACTELPLAFPRHCDDSHFTADGFHFVNTTAVHARAALAEALGPAPGA